MEQDELAGMPVDECLTMALDEIKGALSTKVCNIGVWVKNLESEAEAIRAEEARLALRRKAKDTLMDRLKAWVLRNIEAGAKFEDARCQVGTRKSQSCEIVDLTQIPKEFLKTIVQTVAMKDEIKTAIKAGREVPGAKMIDSLNLTIK